MGPRTGHLQGPAQAGLCDIRLMLHAALSAPVPAEVSPDRRAGALTKMGRKMVEFPLDPPLAKMLLTGAELGCAAEVRARPLL